MQDYLLLSALEQAHLDPELAEAVVRRQFLVEREELGAGGLGTLAARGARRRLLARARGLGCGDIPHA